MAWRDRLTVYARCPVHARYNPETGQGAIKAGCETCWRLYVMYHALGILRASVKRFCDDTAARRKP